MDQNYGIDENFAENKILILYILKKVNKPLSRKELSDLTISIADINYFYFQQFLTDLLETNFIKIHDGETELYELTPEGQNALDLTINLIPGITKLKIDSQFKENFDSIKDKFSISAESTPTENNEFAITCKIIENHIDIFKITTYVGSQEQAGKIVNNWNQNAVEIYPKILELLSDIKN